MRRPLMLVAVVVLAVLAVGCDYTKEHHESLALVYSPGISGHNVMIPYQLLGTELTGINVYYSTDGRFWSLATPGYGGDGYQGLETSVVGVMHGFAWDSLADIGPTLSLNVLVKIVPWGRGDGIEGTSPVFIVNNSDNTGPQAMITSSWNPATPESGDIVVQYRVFDAEADTLTGMLWFSLAGSESYPATIGGGIGRNSVGGIDSSYPTDTQDEYGQLSSWLLTGVDLGVNTDAQWNMYARLTGSGGTRQVFVYSNSGMSSLIAEGTRTGDGRVILAERNVSGLSGSVSVAYTQDDTYVELKCHRAHSLVWDSLVDIGKNYQSDVRLRVEVLDGAYEGTTTTEEQLSVDNTGL